MLVAMQSTFSKQSWIVFGALLCGAGLLPAQTGDTLSTEVKFTYSTIKNNLLRLAEKMPKPMIAKLR